jgi:type II secretion system protein H
MRQSRPSKWHGRDARVWNHGRDARATPRRAFTLIELIFVLALLAICAVFVASSMGPFMRGRALNFEARRLLSLTHYAQSRAVAEGVPVLLWVNAAQSTYGLAVQSSFSDPEGDARAVRYTAEASLKLETSAAPTPQLSEQDDERLGLPDESLAFIRFTPDGFFDDSGVAKITVRLGAEGLDLVPNANRLGFEIRPAAHAN